MQKIQQFFQEQVAIGSPIIGANHQRQMPDHNHQAVTLKACPCQLKLILHLYDTIRKTHSSFLGCTRCGTSGQSLLLLNLAQLLAAEKEKGKMHGELNMDVWIYEVCSMHIRASRRLDAAFYAADLQQMTVSLE